MHRTQLHIGSLVLVAALAAGACGTEGEPAGADTSGLQDETYDFATGPEMLPGQNCRACHGAPSSAYPEAPDWSFAGTVFEQPDSDVGAEGVTVTVVDATGAKATAITNRAGNFYSPRTLVAPYSVSLSKGKRSVTMAVFPPAGGCNACHAASPVGGAPGRLYLPTEPFASAATCDGNHTVTVGDTSYDCTPYRCEPVSGACLPLCTDDSACVEGERCNQGRCAGE
jgi:hypothetical protein